MTWITWILIAIAVIAVLVAAAIGWSRYRTRQIAAEAERLVPPRGKFIAVNGRRLHYLDTGGDKPVLLFVHGLGGNLHNFDWPLWEELGDDYRMITVDRTGSGYSTSQTDHSGRIVDHADDMDALLEALGVGKAVLVGHSLGGAISLATALRHPERVAGLALLAPLTKSSSEVPTGFGPIYIPSPRRRRFIANTFAVPAAVRMRDQTLAFVFGPQEPPEGYVIEGGAMISVRPSHFYATSTDFGAINDDLPELEKHWSEIAVPVGILYGTGDRLLDYRQHGEAMREKLPELDLELLDDVGHMVQYSRPKETAAFIRRIADRAFAA